MTTTFPEQQTESTAPEAVVKDAVAAYMYLYPLVVVGVSYEVLTNVEKPTWEKLSAPINQLMSVRESRPDRIMASSCPAQTRCIRRGGVTSRRNPWSSQRQPFQTSPEPTKSAL